MFYHRKIILSLLQLFDGQSDKIRLQKPLILFALRQQKAVYDFVPYWFGYCSYSDYAGIIDMVRRENTAVNFRANSPSGYFQPLPLLLLIAKPHFPGKFTAKKISSLDPGISRWFSPSFIPGTQKKLPFTFISSFCTLQSLIHWLHAD